MKSFEIGQGQWNPPVINVPEIRDITGQVIVDAIEGKDVAASAKKAAELMDKKMEMITSAERVRISLRDRLEPRADPVRSTPDPDSDCP